VTAADWSAAIGLVLAVLAVGVVLVGTAIGIHHLRNESRVRLSRKAAVKAAVEGSAVLHMSRRLTAEYKTVASHSSPIDFHYSVALKSKRSLERFKFADWMVDCVQDDSGRIAPRITAIRHADSAYSEYEKAYSAVWAKRNSYPAPKDLDDKGQAAFLARLEAKYRSEKAARPATGGKCRFVATYTSPAGNNHYERSGELSINQIAQILEI